MSVGRALLPSGFDALEPFVATWDLATAEERAKRRLVTPESERLAFYQAGVKLLAPGLELLDRKPLAALDESETRLMQLLLSLAHVSLSIEVQGPDEPKHAEGARYLEIIRMPGVA